MSAAVFEVGFYIDVFCILETGNFGFGTSFFCPSFDTVPLGSCLALDCGADNRSHGGKLIPLCYPSLFNCIDKNLKTYLADWLNTWLIIIYT